MSDERRVTEQAETNTGPEQPEATSLGVVRGRGRTKPSSGRPADMSAERLTDARVAEIRARIAKGAYRSRAVAEEVARRLLDSGDL
jgi:anti-sigma28 factor (negative regulator of flagellin synthesis)